MAEIFDEVPQVPMQGKGKDGKEGKDGKGGYSPWTGAGRAIAAKARSAWRSVASPPGLGLPSAGSTAGAATVGGAARGSRAPHGAAPAAQHGAQHGVSSTAVPPGFLPPQVSSCASAPHASFSSKKLSSLRWHAVWCHERCHKTDAATLRAQLQLVISRYNGELICQKTAGKFKLWLDQERGKGATEESFYILLSDWRQLKPCMDILQEGVEQPAAVILLCEQAKGVAKAQLWNDSRPPTPFPLFFLQLQEDQWVVELEEIISSIGRSPPAVHPQSTTTGLAQAWNLPRGSSVYDGHAGPAGPVPSAFYDAPLSPTRFSL